MSLVRSLKDKISKKLSGNKNLFIVSTTLQLLSAIEARDYFKTTNNVLVILSSSSNDKTTTSRLLELSRKSSFNTLLIYDYSDIMIMQAPQKYLKEFKHNKYDYVFIGDVTYKFRQILSNINYNKFFLLDQESQKIKVQHFKDGIKSKKAIFLYTIKGYKIDCGVEGLILFSSNVSNLPKNIKVVEHSFVHIQELYAKENLDRKCYLTAMRHVALDKSPNKHIASATNFGNNSIETLRYKNKRNKDIYVYPTGLASVPKYKKELLTFLEENEIKYIYDDKDTDVERIKELQFSLIFLDHVSYELRINNLINIFIERIDTFIADDTVLLVRFIGLLKILNQAMRLLFHSTNYFILKRASYIKVENFYILFDKMTEYYSVIEHKVEKKEKEFLLNQFMWIFSHYAKRASYYGEAKLLNNYLENNKDVFKEKLIDLLLFSSFYPYYKNNCTYEKMLYKYYDIYILKEKYKDSSLNFFMSTKICLFLNEDLESLAIYYLDHSEKFENVVENINILKILINVPATYPLIEEALWALYSDVDLHKKHRVRAGLTLVEATRKIGNINKAKKLFLQILNTFKCTNQSEAMAYIAHLEPLGILFSRKDIFYDLYYKYIFKNLVKKIGVDTTRDFLFCQGLISKLDKLKYLEKIYQSVMKPKVEKLIKNNNFKEIVYINPFHEMNNFTFPIHLYNSLLDKKVLVVNIENGYIDFFNEYPNESLPTLCNANDAILKSGKHWHEYYCDWEVAFDDKKILCDGINIYQGLFEQISRVQKRFTIDFDSVVSKSLLKLFKTRIDRNMYIAKSFMQKPNVPVKFFSVTSHYTPWSIYRDKAYALNNPSKFSFLHAVPTYENYIHKMKNNTLSTIAALNITKYQKSRIAGFGASELFVEYTKKEYENITLPLVLNRKVPNLENSDIECLRQISKAKEQGKTVICLLGKIVYDLAVPNMRGTFSDMKNWVQETLEFTKNRDEFHS